MPPNPWPRPRPAARAANLLLLAAPGVVLVAAGARFTSPILLAAGVGLGALAAFLVRAPAVWRPPASGPLVLIYVIAWITLAAATLPAEPHPFAAFARGLLLLVAVGLFAGHDLHRTGLGPRRRAHRLCRQLAGRAHWPERIDDYPLIPEVQQLHQALRDDPSPVMALLTHPSPAARGAGFVAIQGRPGWRPADAAAVAAALRVTPDPELRALGVLALTSAEDSAALAEVGARLRDPAPQVRAAAAEAALAGGAKRWAELRGAIREALADPSLAHDGPLPGAGGRLTGLAVADLSTWATESLPLSHRSLKTLVAHYAARLQAADDASLPAELGQVVTDATAPPALRVELAGLLRDYGLMTPERLDRMSDVDQPGPLRLLAAEVLLADNPDHPEALDVLRGLGRQSNRDTVLSIARILQTYLRLDMGLPDDGPVAPASRAATEAARRVQMWATGGKPGFLASPLVTQPLSVPTLSPATNRPGGIRPYGR